MTSSTLRYRIDTIDKPAFLIVVMRAFQGKTSHISLEGDLSSYPFNQLEDASFEERGVLKRQTLFPAMDLVVAPLDEINIGIISRAVARREGLSKVSGLIHVQIAKNDQLVFGGYDNFHRDCVFVEGLAQDVLADLKARHILRNFEAAPAT